MMKMVNKNEYGQAWFEKHKYGKSMSLDGRNHGEVRQPRTIVQFNRKTFVEKVKKAFQHHENEGLVFELKRRREFALQAQRDYEVYTDEQRLNMLLALSMDLGTQDLSLLVRSLPSILRAHLVLNVISASLGFCPQTDLETYKRVKHGLVPIPEHFFMLLSSVPGGFSFLLRLRTDLLLCLKKFGTILSQEEVHALEYLDMILCDLFGTQSGVKFTPIDMENPTTIAFILNHERVHEIRSWQDLEYRLTGPNRHCFGPFHANIPLQPLVFVETIFTNGLCSNIHSIILDSKGELLNDYTREIIEKPTHAMFYSVSTTNMGIRGLNLASHLLFLTIERISRQYPTCHTFATLSPVPGFRRWFKSIVPLRHYANLLTEDNINTINEKFGVSRFQAIKWFLKTLEDESRQWFQNDAFVS